MRLAVVVPLILTGLWSSGCEKEDATVNSGPPPGVSYGYTSYDSSGTIIAQGWFTLVTTDSPRVSGEWHFVQLAGGSGIGPQVGDGILAGEFRDGHLWVELNPQFRDNNLELAGEFSAAGYSGTWAARGVMGVYNHGTFKAPRLLEMF